MADAQLEIFTVTDPRPDELATFKFALSIIRMDVRSALPDLMAPHRVHYTDNIQGTSAVPRPEGRYSGNRLIQVRPMRRDDRILRNRVAGTTIHEMGHGFRLSENQRQKFVQLFDRTGGWRDGQYWVKVNEAFCYWLTRIATDGQLVSPYEAKTLDLDDDRRTEFLAILLGDPGGTRDDPVENEAEPGPDPELTAMLERAEAAERERDELLAWQIAVREAVGKATG